MAMFMEERLYENIDYGSDFSSEYSNSVVETVGGDEYRSQRHPFVVARLGIEFERQTNFVVSEVIDLNNRAGGTLRGFRVMHPVDFSTNNYRDTPTMLDQHLPLVNPTVPGVYQLMRWFGDYTDAKCARRRIRKPVAGSVLIAVAGAAYPAAQWSVDNATGLVTMAANKTGTITAISKASSAVITVANSNVVGESIVISGVAGMTEINGLRALITARTAGSITVAINTAAFSDYTSGGTVNTRPQTGEAVTAGCTFDLPMRFNANLGGRFSNWDTITARGVDLIEILNP
ncbi:MAG TPA: DUF2460 domain-containing protein [Pseudomonas sp.]|nr:DUF2460 domain-containing protein [Pseudomonas sp.]